MNEPVAKKPTLFDRIVRVVKEDWRLQAFLMGLLLFLIVTVAVSAKALFLLSSDERVAAFWIGLSGAFIEDLSFFVLIGGVAIVMTLARPQNEILEQRVRYMFNSKRVTPGAYAHIRNELKSLGVFSPICRYVITYTEFNPSIDAVKAVVQSDRIIANMFKNEDFVQEDAEYAVHTDPVSPPGGVRGELLFAAIETPNGRLDVIDKPIAVKGDSLKQSARISIPPDDEVKFTIKYWVWHKVGEAYAVTPKRYSEVFDIKVVNATDHVLVLASLGKSEPIVLTPGSHHPYNYPSLAAGRLQPFVLEKVSSP